MSEPKEPCQECAGECGLVCECSDCDCKLTPETASLVAEFSHREIGM